MRLPKKTCTRSCCPEVRARCQACEPTPEEQADEDTVSLLFALATYNGVVERPDVPGGAVYWWHRHILRFVVSEERHGHPLTPRDLIEWVRSTLDATLPDATRWVDELVRFKALVVDGDLIRTPF